MIRYLYKLSVLKIYNLFKAYTGFFFSVMFKKPVIFGYPPFLSIEPVNYCNLKCPHCVTGSGKMERPKTEMDLKWFEKIIDESAPYLAYLMMWFQGEPLLHPHIIDMLRYVRRKKIYTVISTNAQLITPFIAAELVAAQPDEIIFSYDGESDDTYESYRRGGSRKKVLEAIHMMNMAKKNLKVKYPLLILQFIIFRHNEKEIDEIKRLKKKYRLHKVIIKTARLIEFDEAEKWLPEDEKLSRYIKKTKGWITKKKKTASCFRLWTTPVVCSNGIVVPCCYDYNANYSMGNIRNNGLYEIWHNKVFMQLRMRKLKNEKIDICENCNG